MLANPLETPSMKQYLNIKKNYPDSILFFRLGDFYEMFLEDAEIASKILDIALTKRQNIIMCGIPYHSCDFHIAKLLKSGKKVAICEQKKPQDKNIKLMSREVVRVVTPGTVVEDRFLPSFEHNFLAICLSMKEQLFINFCDISTGDVFHISFSKSDTENIKSLFLKFQPSEICVPDHQKTEILKFINFRECYHNAIHFTIDSEKKPFELLESFLEFYLNSNYKNITHHLKKPIFLNQKMYMEMDSETISNLELVENPKENKYTLFQVLDFCYTAKGKRLLKQKILFPIYNLDEIKKKWENIEKLKKISLDKITDCLKKIVDIERILTRFQSNKVYPKDFASIDNFIDASFELLKILQKESYPFIISSDLKNCSTFIQDRVNLENLPLILGNGYFIKKNYHKDLDQAREAKEKGKDWILALEEEEKKATKISFLKIRYNKVLGYFIEIPRSQSKFIPNHFIKKQTLVSTERYSSEKLEKIQISLLQADDRINHIEKEEFEILQKEVLHYYAQLIQLSEEISELDCCVSFLKAAEKYNYVKPDINNDNNIELKKARHPVVEAFLSDFDSFVPNDVFLDKSKNKIAILTGPNMAGKSTYIRQIALNQILFQMGSYVACSSGSFSLCDKLFTRIGSGDNLTSGESTFLVEMKETANILKTSTENSLAIFDEVGRGTSTYDGLSIAWAIIEYLSKNQMSPKTIFATHYHELTNLDKLDGVFNLFMEVYEQKEKVIFLRKVKKGKAGKSFGLYVAKLAGIPNEILLRSKELLKLFESKKKSVLIENTTTDLFTGLNFSNSGDTKKLKKIKNFLNDIDINQITPLKALELLQEGQNLINKKE